MLFTTRAYAALADGSITLTFRGWKRPQAKVGGRYRVGSMTIEVDAMERVGVDSIGDVDARRAGEPDAAAVRRRLGVTEGEVWRIEFHRVADEPDRRAELAADDRLSAEDLAAVTARLDRLDRASSTGPWTQAVLDLIDKNPGVVSTELAETLGRDRPSFKIDVRKLKALGLTESLTTGYRLTPRGRVVQRARSQGE
jgi:hypothetical protein